MKTPINALTITHKCFFQELQVESAPHTKQKAGGTQVVSKYHTAPTVPRFPSSKNFSVFMAWKFSSIR